MTLEDKNRIVGVKTTKEVTRKLKLVTALRGNSESMGALIGALVDKELKRLGLQGNNDE